MEKKETNNKLVDLDSNLPIIALTANGLNVPIKTQRLSDGNEGKIVSQEN